MSAPLAFTGEGHCFVSVRNTDMNSRLRLMAWQFDIMEFERSNNNATFGDRSGGQVAKIEGGGLRNGGIAKCASTKRPNLPRSTTTFAAFAEFGIVPRMFVYSRRCRR